MIEYIEILRSDNDNYEIPGVDGDAVTIPGVDMTVKDTNDALFAEFNNPDITPPQIVNDTEPEPPIIDKPAMAELIAYFDNFDNDPLAVEVDAKPDTMTAPEAPPKL